jgi:dipeptidyl aminopeptidase/acylaminoacyl peptidase
MLLKNPQHRRQWGLAAAGLILLLLTTACQRTTVTVIPTLMPTAPATMVNQDVEAIAVEPSPTPVAIPPTETLTPTTTSTPTPTSTPTDTPTATPTATPTHPLMIEVMRQQTYPGSAITFEQTLEPGSNYQRYVVSYLSEGNKIYALLTVPQGEMPDSGWPIIIFNHGYIPPDEYRTTERYVDYVDALAKSGYIVFRSDYRGHGNSEGEAVGSYSSPAYTIDVLNGMASVQRLPEADPERVGMWGHSMGGHITLRAMVVSQEIDAGVIWAGVVASYPDLFERWRRRPADEPTPTPDPTSTRGRWRQSLVDTYGSIEENPVFWASISANTYVKDLSGPLQLHHGTSDSSVPYEFSQILLEQVLAAGKTAELFLYEGDNHNLSGNFGRAMGRSIQFFDQYVKGTE